MMTTLYKRAVLPIFLLLMSSLFMSARTMAQDARFWVGGSGDWEDAAHWSLTTDGSGGAGAPGAGDTVRIAPGAGDIVVHIGTEAEAGPLHIDGSRGGVTLAGDRGQLDVAGDISLKGSVAWSYTGPVELTARRGVTELDLRGIPISGDVRLVGGGTWSMLSDLVLAGDHVLDLAAGTLVTNGTMLRAGRLTFSGHRAKQLMAGNSVVLLDEVDLAGTEDGIVDAGTSRLLVGGVLTAWGGQHPGTDGDQRSLNSCGTGPGQTPFTIDAELVSDFNGFGVSCHAVCDGSVHVAVIGGVGPFTYSWVGGPTSATWNNACAGNQIVIVTDQGQAVSCATTVQVTDPAHLSVIFSGNAAPTCAGICNGSSNATAVGGVPGYNYSWNNGVGTGASFNALCPGGNTLHLTDANLCAFDTTFLFDVPAIVPNLVVTNTICAGSCNGTASVAPTGGTGALTFDWGPGSPQGDGTNTISQLCPGNWTVTIVDANGCDTTVQFQVFQPSIIQPNATHTNALCFNSCDGTATVAPTGPAGPFDYTWTPVPPEGQGTPMATGLCPGAYQVTITDMTTGCDTTVTITITAPPQLVPNSTAVDPLCNNSCDGSITVAPSGAPAPYTYVWSPVPPVGQGTPEASQLCAGDWSVTITDADDCDTTFQFTLTAPLPITPNEAHTNMACHGICDGMASVAPTGGSGAFTYDWTPTPPNGQGSPVASGLCAGPWAVTITDVNGCDTTIQFLVTEPSAFNISSTFTNVTCGGNCDGTASLTVLGGTPDYSYVWTPAPGSGQGTAAVGALCPGPYIVTISDSAGCDTTLAFSVLQPSPITASATIMDASCSDVCDGSISLATAGGLPPFVWSWSPVPGSGQGTASVSGLCPGTWSVSISDQSSCDTTLVFTVDSPAPIIPTGTWTNENCVGACDGTASVTATGGDGAFSYMWDPDPAFGQGTPTVSGLCPGNWSVTIADGNGCDTVVTFGVLPATPVTVSLNTQNIVCGGPCAGAATVAVSGGSGTFTYLWEPEPATGQGTTSVTGLCAGPGLVAVMDSAGCDTTLVFNILKNAPIDPHLSVTNESCVGPCSGTASAAPEGGVGPYGYLWQPAPGGGQGTSSVTGLCAGTDYSVTITDSLGCDTTISFSLQPYTPFAPDVDVVPVNCSGLCDGMAAATVPGGGIYTYFWDPVPSNGQGLPTATGLCAGTYQLTVADVAGCDTTVSVVVTSPAPLDPVATIQPVGCSGACTGSIHLAPTGGSGSYTYTWSPTPAAGQGTPTATGLCAGDWSVVVTDAHGCDTTLTFTLAEPLPLADTADVALSHCIVCDGSLDIHVSGGTAPYSFTWGPPLNVTTTDSVQTGLCAGVYSVTITDASGCSLQRTYVISDTDGEEISAIDGITTCPGSCDGAVSVAFNCLVAPCTVAWADGTGAPLGLTTDSIGGLCTGDYFVSVTNGDGCTSIDPASVIAPPSVVATASSTPVTCASDCDGTATVGISGGAGPFTITWSPEPGAGQGTPHATGLCPGLYDIAVEDLAGCDTVTTVQVSAPTPITVAATVTEIGCVGECNGSIALNIQGGSAGYAISWTPVPAIGQGTTVAAGLCPGNYTVTVTDANGCDTTLSFTLVEPPLLVLENAVTTLSHCGICDGTASIDATGGTGPTEITWTNAAGDTVGTGTSVAGLCAGIYFAHATDISGCGIDQVIAIADVAGEAATAINGITLCANSCDGQVSVDHTCDNAPCAVSWFDGDGVLLAQGTDTLTGLCPGAYLVMITNGIGCTSVDTALVVPDQVIMPNVSSTPVSCIAACDGTATVAPTGGVAPYTYAWSPEPGSGQGTATAAGLCAGTWTVMVTDSSGCDTTVSVVVTAPAPLSVAAQVHNISCAGACNGNITLSPAGGSGAYTYSWSPVPSSGQGSNTASGLCSGLWSVTVADVNGCDTTLTYTVTEPDTLSVQTNSTLSTCGLCIGTAAAQADGGTAPYLYTWMQAGGVTATDSAVTGLCAGLYTITVTDAHGCTAQAPVPISDMEGDTVTTTDFLLTCPDLCNGVVSAAYNCSVPSCTVAWFDASGSDLNETGDTLSGQCAGMYFVQVTNGSGCISIDTANVTAPPPIVSGLVFQGETCNGPCDGVASVSPSGGSGSGYIFIWTPAPPTQGNDEVSGLCAGDWSVNITDDQGCGADFPFTIQPFAPIMPVADVQPATCGGSCNGAIALDVTGGVGTYTFNWTPEPGSGQGTSTVGDLCAGDWNVTIADAAGCDTTVTYTITEPTALVVTVDTVIPSSCTNSNDGAISITVTGGAPDPAVAWAGPNGFTSADEDLTALPPGIYGVTVTDQNGCQTDLEVTVPEDDPVVAHAGPDTTVCADLELTLDGSASVEAATYQWTDDQGTVLGTDTTLSLAGISPGSHVYVLTVTNGQCISTDTVVATVLPVPAADAGPDRTIYVEGTVVLGGDPAGTPGSAFQWQPDSLVSLAQAPNPSTFVNRTTLFVLTVTGSDGCVNTDSVRITVVPQVKVPSGFSPNGDGHNDVWQLDFGALFPGMEVDVFNRWGEPLFHSIGYNVPWDGRYAGKLVPVGTYYYTIVLHDPKYPDPLTGPLTVIH
jgi:gliding motility-associated-like protein